MGVRDVARAALAALTLSAVGSPAAAEPDANTVAEMVAWVLSSADNQGLPFAIVDKTEARVFVYDGEGHLQGDEPALLGVAPGDHSAPGVGDRELSAIPPEERTTPAGRFLSGYGPAPGKKKVLWVDYATALSLHPVVTTNRSERRAERLETPSPEDNRITYGCINVSAAFYRDVVEATFRDRGLVYVLPEAQPLDVVFPRFRAHASAARAAAAAASEAAAVE